MVGACVLIAGEDVRDYNDARTSALACLAIELCMSFLLIYLVLSAFLFACMSFALIPGILLSSLTMWSNMPFPTCEPKDVMENLAFARMPSMFLKMTKVLLYCLHENAASRLPATTCRCMLESLLAFATSVPFLPKVLLPSVSANGFRCLLDYFISSRALENRCEYSRQLSRLTSVLILLQREAFPINIFEGFHIFFSFFQEILNELRVVSKICEPFFMMKKIPSGAKN